jgi:hypothetical protein
MKVKDPIFNPYLSAFFFDLVYNLPPDEVKKLPIKYRRILTSEAKTKHWCEKSGYNEKMYFCTLLGLNCAFTILPDRDKIGMSIKRIWEKFEEDRKAAAQSEQVKLKFYVTTSKETAFFMGMCGQTLNGDTYIKSLDYNKTGYALNGWRKRLDTPVQSEVLQVSEHANTIADTIINAGITFDAIRTLFGINDVEAKVLLYTYKFRNKYIGRDEVLAHFDGYIGTVKINNAWKRLHLNEYLSKHPDWRKNAGTISPSGILIANDIINRILKSNQF